MADNPDAKGGPEPPPNLRVSDDEAKECDNCEHYEAGRCNAYPVVGHVAGEWVCDSWAKGSEQDSDEDETPQKDQPKSLKDAHVFVREHFRKARQQAP